MNDAAQSPMKAVPPVLAGDGMAAAVRAHDWSASPLGPPDTWPHALRTLVDVMLAANQPMFVAWGPQRTLLYNDAYVPLLGRKHPAALGRSFMDVWAEAYDDLAPLFDRVFAGDPVHMDHITLILDRHGRPEEAHFAFSYTPVRDETGAVAGLFCACTETTGQVLAERALRESQAWASAVLENIGDGFVLLDRDFRVQQINAEGLRIDGRPREAIIGRHLLDIWPEAANLPPWPAYQSAMASREPVELLYRHVSDAHDVWLETRAYPSGDGLAVFYRDVTEQRAAEARLRETEQRLNAVLDNASVAVFLMDDRQHCAYMNAAAERLTGYAFAETQGQPLHDVIHHTRPDGSHFPLHECAIDRAFPENANTQGEEVFVHKDGHFYPVAFTASPVYDEASKTVGTIIEVRDISAEKAAEAALRGARLAAEELAAEQTAILGQLVEGVIVTDAVGRITFINDAAIRLHGVDRLDVEPDEYSATYHLFTEDGRPYPPHDLPLARAVRGETVTDARWRIRRPDRADLLAIGSARPLFGADGAQIGAVLTLRDDTEREAVERRLRENEARLRALTDNLPSGMVYQVTTGRDGSERRFLYVSQSHEKLTGVPAEAVLADPSIPYEMILPKHRPAMVEAEAAAIRDRKPFDVQVQFRRADGAVRWCRIISAPRPQPDGSLVWDGIQIDITDQKRAETMLRQINERLESRVAEADAARELLTDIVETTDAFIQVADLDYRWLAINRASANEFERIFGVRPKPGDSMLDLLADHPEHRAAVQAIWSRALSGEEFTAIDEFGDPDLDRRYYEMKFNVLRDRDGRQIGAYQFVYDVTERLRNQARLVLAEEALRQAQKMEAVGQLTGGIAHDFNNMLAIVIGSLDLLGRRLGETDARARRHVDNAMEGARRAATLTQRLLAFSRQQPLAPEPIDANKLVAGMADLLGRSLSGNVQLETALAGGLWRTHADPNQLESAILNLAVNAKDAMPDGGRLTIETQNAHLDERYAARHLGVSPGQYVMIAVTDTGTGMAADVIARAFDPFFTTKEIGKGTGLGLSMVYGFVKQTGGHVKIYSEPGQGTTVKLYLPRYLAADHQAADDPGSPPELPVGEAREVVLVVEDEEAVRRFSVEALRELGYEVVEADSAATALRALHAHPEIALLFTDVVMPEVNGRKLADEAQQLRPDLKVLFTTGYTRNAVVHNGVLDPGVRLIGKPFTIDELAMMVRETLDGQGP